ncbi:A-kinase anchor protein 17B-like [Rhinoderma darwinii]|uniref:A-kinase anchor protein 17B-like n=1 Tax=Rhinoderma darwinii TaxID=43563 RepID=UPI003F6770B0
MIVTPVYDDSEAVELGAIYHLYLKPKAKLMISARLPKEIEKCRPISNWDILEELKNLVAPDHFSSLRVSRTTKEFIQIEGETDTKHLAYSFLEKLNGQNLPLSYLPEPLHIEVTEATAELPGNDKTKKILTEEPDDNEEEITTISCIHLEGLPCKWFLALDTNTEKPSEEVLRSTFEKFGNIANIDIPMLDPYREDCSGKQLSTGGLQPFDAFLQYEDMSSTTDAVRSLQGMKLMFTAEDGKSLACDIKISIDETNHFSEEAVNKRTAERLKLQELEQQRKKEKEEEEAAERKRKLEERKARARKRRARLKRKLQKQKQNEQKALQQQNDYPEEEDTQEWQERKLLLAQRRLESIILLTTILDKVNDLFQVNKLEEEQINCEFVGLSDCSVSTYSENSKVMSLHVSEAEESNHHETEIFTKDEVEISISKADTQTHKYEQRMDTMTENNNQNLPDEDTYFEGETYKEQDTQMTYGQRIFKLSQDDPINRASKKRKIYETDEFINYLLNYYHYPEYARLFLETKENPNNPWCRRVVRWKGNSFQIKLQNLNGHFAEMNFMPELEEETEDDSGEWEAPVEQSEGNSQESLDRKDATESYRLLVKSGHEFPVTKATKPCLIKTCERSYEKTWDNEGDSLSSVSNSELKEVLEEVSSTSEYFSEDLREIPGKPTNIRRTSRKERRIKQFQKLKRLNVPGHPQFCHHEDLLDHLLHSYCQRLKKHSRCQPTHPHRRKPALHQYDSETSDFDSDTEAQVQATWKRKRSKLKNRNCLLQEKKVNKEMYSSSESEKRSSDPHQHKGNIWRHHLNGKPKRKVHKTGSSDSDEKTSRRWEYCFAEDVSESNEHGESPWDAEETHNRCSPSSSHQTAESKPPGGQTKSSYSDYWDWEHSFYKGDECKI